MKKIMCLILLSFTNIAFSNVLNPAHVITKAPSIAITLSGLDVAALAVIPLNKYFDMARHDPEGAQTYLSKHPIQRNIIRVKTFNALRNSKNKDEYQRIHDNAVDYFGFNQLPPYEKTDFDTSIPNLEPADINNQPLINPIHDAHPDDVILINPITKIKINVTIEYPTEDIRNWKDYMIIIKDSTILGRNLEKKGQTRPQNAQAHHIIPVKAAGANSARDIWVNKCQQDINSAENGVFLPNGKNIDPTLANAIIHYGQHGNVHTFNVNKEVVSAYNQNGCNGVYNIVSVIRSKLLNGKNKNWSNVI